MLSSHQRKQPQSVRTSFTNVLVVFRQISDRNPCHVHVHLLAQYKNYKSVRHPTLYVCDFVDLLLILGRSTGAEGLK